MILEQYYLDCLSHASYLVADERSARAAVIDPQRDVEQYLADAKRHSCSIEHVFLTHFHADFVAGHLELRARTGAAIHLGARASAEYAFTPMADGESVSLGDVRLEVIETPGHSPESISILVFDGSRSEQPRAVLTGDTLFIGDVGRPDLRAELGWSAEELASMLYDSVHRKLVPLPPGTLVYPAHGAGSLCGKNISTETVSTIAVQRRDNHALAPMTREQFVELVTADLPDAPPYFAYDAALNTRERPTLDHALARELRALPLDAALELLGAGAQLLDARDGSTFANAHLRGSVNVGLDGSYASWCGTFLDHDAPIVLVADLGREAEAAMRLGRIGFDNVAGYLEGGIDSVGDHRLLERVQRISPASLADWLGEPTPPVVVDVRNVEEWQERRIQSALSVPLLQLSTRSEGLPAERSLVVHCASGYRSSIAASVLRREGFASVCDLVGGFEAWERAGLPTTSAPVA